MSYCLMAGVCVCTWGHYVQGVGLETEEVPEGRNSMYQLDEVGMSEVPGPAKSPTQFGIAKGVQGEG